MFGDGDLLLYNVHQVALNFKVIKFKRNLLKIIYICIYTVRDISLNKPLKIHFFIDCCVLTQKNNAVYLTRDKSLNTI